MTSGPLVWITGASSGIGAALCRSVPWSGARLVGVSRRPPPEPAEHLAADLADPASWNALHAAMVDRLAGFDGDRVVLIHAAGTVDPIGFAGQVDGREYAANVVLNSAAPQAVGHGFLAATDHLKAQRHLVLMTSGAAATPYPGWSSYGAGKAAVDQWVRTVGAEQSLSDNRGAHVIAVAPGTVDTGMQARIRETPEAAFPQRAKFAGLHERGELTSAEEVARRIWTLIDDGDVATGSVVDLRKLGPG